MMKYLCNVTDKLNVEVFLTLFFRLAYFKAAFELFEADYYVKADDDIYLRPGI